MSAQRSRGANDAGWSNGLCWAPHSGGGRVGGAHKKPSHIQTHRSMLSMCYS